jgi:uncharacterized membrane protein YraQ (UPF0718 family)
VLDETTTQRFRVYLGLLTSYANSIVHVSVRTGPLILVGIWASMWIMRRLPPQLGAATGAHVLAVVMIALVAAILTLPSLFEIPLALSMLAVGGPGESGRPPLCRTGRQSCGTPRDWPLQ